MASNPPIAVYDACVLYPFHLRNLLVQCAVDRLVDAHWTDAIHDEWIRNLSVNNPALPVRQLNAARDLMNAAVPGALIKVNTAAPSIDLPDPNDQHVLAAAVTVGASAIVTWNLKDFPAESLRDLGPVAQTPDRFLTALHDANPDILVAVVARARRNLRRSQVPPADFLEALRRQNLTELVSRLEERREDL
ncbi:PIN domain-containing protein [Rhodopila sp.]|uniref:PIN domain-containing protein n=1 Tax=Rhodopila sp. TaxID=2480087 RepID=UPI002C0DE717|nr:PIN domain-containing protein [Rhodopila sp.]HVZ07790.1 PIN domain-containing protein [Rhodopila sp.]